MKLINVSWPGFVLKGRVLCPKCNKSAPYRFYREGMSMGAAMNAALGEVAGMICKHCGYQHVPGAVPDEK